MSEANCTNVLIVRDPGGGPIWGVSRGLAAIVPACISLAKLRLSMHADRRRTTDFLEVSKNQRSSNLSTFAFHMHTYVTSVCDTWSLVALNQRSLLTDVQNMGKECKLTIANLASPAS
jgi:hypothetical protein